MKGKRCPRFFRVNVITKGCLHFFSGDVWEVRCLWFNIRYPRSRLLVVGFLLSLSMMLILVLFCFSGCRDFCPGLFGPDLLVLMLFLIE